MNSKMKIQIALFLIFFLLIVGTIWWIMTGSDTKESVGNREVFPYRPSVQQSSANETVPPSPLSVSPSLAQPSMPSPVVFPSATASAVVPTPDVPTPTPFIPTPVPAGLPLGSGTISSGKPWLLNIHADWSAVTAAGNKAQVEVIVYADHYSISYNAFESLVIRLGEDSHRMLANAIHSDNNMPQSTELGRYTYTIPLSPGETISLPLSAVWEFEGTYGDGSGNAIDIQSLRCEGIVEITG